MMRRLSTVSRPMCRRIEARHQPLNAGLCSHVRAFSQIFESRDDSETEGESHVDVPDKDAMRVNDGDHALIVEVKLPTDLDINTTHSGLPHLFPFFLSHFDPIKYLFEGFSSVL